MFLDQLSPVFKELTQYPVAFLGGFFSGILRLNLSDDPVKSWLDRQAGTPSQTPGYGDNTNDGSRSGPQSIAID